MPKAGCQCGSVLGGLSLRRADGRLLTVPSRGRRRRKAALAFSSLSGSHPLDLIKPHCLPQVPYLNTLTLRAGAWTCTFERGTQFSPWQ